MRTQACNNLGPTRFIAPSPSGKAPDSDSGIGGSNPSGAAKHERSDLTIGPFCCPITSAQHSGDGARTQPCAPRSNSDRRKRRPHPALVRKGCCVSQARHHPQNWPLALAGITPAAARRRRHRWHLVRDGHPAFAEAARPGQRNLPRNPAHRRPPTAGSHCADPRTTKARHNRAFEAGAPANRDATNAMDQRLENWVARRALCRPTFLRSTSRASRVMKPALRSSDFRVSSYSTSARAMPRRIAPA